MLARREGRSSPSGADVTTRTLAGGKTRSFCEGRNGVGQALTVSEVASSSTVGGITWMLPVDEAKQTRAWVFHHQTFTLSVAEALFHLV